MKGRVQIWMDRAEFLALQKFLESDECSLSDTGGPLEALAVAVWEARNNNANEELPS